MSHKRLAITKTCQHCGKPFHPWSESSKFCCKKCQIMHMTNLLRERISVKCPTCGTNFEIVGARLERTNLNFCSVKCRGKYFATHSVGRRICPECKFPFSVPMSFPRKKYCCETCRNRASKKRVATRETEKIRQVEEFSTLFKGHGMDANYDPFGGVAI